MERILIALSESERNQFWPDFNAEDFAPVQISWVQPEDLASPEKWLHLLEEVRPTVLVSAWSTPRIPFERLSQESGFLRYVCYVCGSVKNVVPREFIARGGLVTNWGSLASHAVAEHALLLILASLRNLPAWYPASRASDIKGQGKTCALQTRSLRGRSVGIHGFGHIARELVRLLRPFDVTCMAFSKNVPDEEIRARGILPCASLENLFAQNRIVVECEALNAATLGMVTRRHFELMPQGGVFVNVGRGAVVDEAAMLQLAARGRIQVASDVFINEPVPPDSPIHQIPNLIASPHIAGPTADLYSQCGDLALSNIRNYLAGEPLAARVDLEIYDRST